MRSPPPRSRRASGNGGIARAALAEVGFEPARALIPISGGLGEELHDEIRDDRGELGRELARRRRHPREVAVQEIHGVRRRERRGAGQHLVERDAERVEVAAPIERPVHPPGLLRRDIGERPLQRFGARELLGLLREPRGDAEAEEPDTPRPGVDQQVLRPDVLVDDVAPVDRLERLRRRRGDPERGPEPEPARQEQLPQRAAARVRHDEQQPVAVLLQVDGLDDALEIELREDGVIVAQPGDLLRGRAIAGDRAGEDALAVLATVAPVEHRVLSALELLDERITADADLGSRRCGHRRQVTAPGGGTAA
jgi:hypothetical protein